MLVADESGQLVAANSVWLDFVGPLPDSWTALLEPESRRRMEQHLADVAAGRPAPGTIDVEMLTRAGRHWTRWWARREHLEGAVLITLVVIDVNDEVSRTQDLRQLATHDHMTGLLNRRFFMEALAQAKRRAARSGVLLALLYVDLDHFKSVNDIAGHAVGDEVLAVVAGRLQSAIRGADLAARLGGDEFALLLEDVSGPEHAEAVAARIASSLADPVEVGGRRWPLSASVGIAVAAEPDESPEAWLHRADAAMYAAKRRRRSAQPVLIGAGAGSPLADGPDGWGDPAGSSAPSGAGETAEGRSADARAGGGGGGGSTSPAAATLDRLRALRDDLARVTRSLDEFDERLRA
jgi:diguanylate cyclase (GGDEF)-like protein